MLRTKAEFKRPRNCAQDENSARMERSSPELKPLSPVLNRLNVGAFNESATLAAKKLGLEEVAFKTSSSTPNMLSPTAQSSASSSLSSPPTSCIDDTGPTESKMSPLKKDILEMLSREEIVPEQSHVPKCPVCKVPVDSLFLEGFAGNRRLTIREQAKFCQAHKRRTANMEWRAKRYPEIDWPCLHMQVKIHSEAIDEILKGERFSFYRNAYDDYLKREKHRTLQQSLVQGDGIESFSPGYYGSRGAKIMCVKSSP